MSYLLGPVVWGKKKLKTELPRYNFLMYADHIISRLQVLGNIVVNYSSDSRIYINLPRGHSGLIVSVLTTGSSGPGLSPGRGHCVVFLGKTLYSHSDSLHPGV